MNEEYEVPNISAKSWALFNSQSGKVIWLKDAHKKEIEGLQKQLSEQVQKKKSKVDTRNREFERTRHSNNTTMARKIGKTEQRIGRKTSTIRA